jgi:hypothetical protein
VDVAIPASVVTPPMTIDHGEDMTAALSGSVGA